MKKITDEMVDALHEVEDSRGRLTAAKVVDAAAADDSPLHGWFTWDDQAAARKQRLAEAKELIRTVRMRVVVEEVLFVVPSYIRDPQKAGHIAGYQVTLRIGKRDVAAALCGELRQIVGLCERLVSIMQARRPEVPAELARGILSLQSQATMLADMAANDQKAVAAG